MAPKYEILDAERVDGREGSNVVTMKSEVTACPTGCLSSACSRRTVQ
jgi:hypothetical protein